MKKTNIVLAVLILIVVGAIVVGALLYRNARLSKQADDLGKIKTKTEAKYAKGSVAFFYPADWLVNDIPAAEGMISAQVSDPKDMIVFVASSNRAYGDPKVNGDLKYDKEITLAGAQGKERLWEDQKSQAVIFRADGFRFQDRYYRFEMFSNLSRKVKAENIWRDILASVKFSESEKEGIEAKPAGE